MRSVKVVLDLARLSFLNLCLFSFARVEEVESDDDVRFIFAGVLCHELRVGAARCAVIVKSCPPVGVWSTGFFLRSFAGLRNETACLALRQRLFAAGVGGCRANANPLVCRLEKSQGCR